MLLAKLITNRLQSYIKRIMEKTQSAFVKGRCIADNTILMREVTHTFNLEDYQPRSFTLKADINKALDTIEWSFVRGVLEAVGVPELLVELIMSCMEEVRVTVLVNEKGDEFF
jgi:Reverse transcriptase (RNA-dependent DNA polymerase)